MEPQGMVRAAGAVLWRPKSPSAPSSPVTPTSIDGASVEVAVVHRPRYDDWSLPKGKLIDGETVPAAAIREVREETGYDAVLARKVGVTRYPAPAPAGWLKQVDYFSARATSGGFTPNAEVDELRWLPVSEARKCMSRPADGGILDAFAALPAALHTVLLVRHAKAGNKSAWQHDDALRPLSASGHKQAEAIRALLPLFGVQRVFSAPRVRCTQTVQAVAEDHGLAVEPEMLFSEEGYWGAEREALSCLYRIAALPGASVLSSQGGVIPDLVRALGAPCRDGELGQVPSKKGSVWVLSFQVLQHGPELVAADYYATALPAPPPAANDTRPGAGHRA